MQATVTQQSTRAVATLRQMRFGERANIKYAKNFVEENKDKKNEWTRLKIPQGIMSVH